MGGRRGSPQRRPAAHPARRPRRIVAFGRVVPAPLRGTVVPVIAGAVRGDLEVLTELLISRLPPQRQDVFSQLVPVQVKCERVENKRLRYEVVEQHNADLFEEMRQQNVVVMLQLLFQESRKRGSRRLGVEDRHDAEQCRGVLWGNATEARRGLSLHWPLIVARSTCQAVLSCHLRMGTLPSAVVGWSRSQPTEISPGPADRISGRTRYSQRGGKRCFFGQPASRRRRTESTRRSRTSRRTSSRAFARHRATRVFRCW